MITNIIFIVIFIVFLCYYNAFNCGFVFDDMSAVRDNKDLRPQTNLYELFLNDFWGTPMSHEKSHKSYRPLCVLTFRMNYAFDGTNPTGYHVVNVVLHMIVCVQIYYLSIALSLSSTTGIISSILFATHPVHVEAVTGVVGRAELLSSIFYLLAIIIFISTSNYTKGTHYVETVKSSEKQFNYLKLLTVIALTCAATISKEQGITAVGICCVWEVFGYLRIRFPDIKEMYKDISSGKMADYKSKRLKHSFFKIMFIVGCTFILLFARLKVMGVQLPVFTQFDNPAAAAERLPKLLTHTFMLPVNMWLMFCPSWLCCDWTMGTIPILRDMTDIRNLAIVAFIIALILFFYQSTVKYWPIYLPVVISLIVLPFLPASNLFFPVGFVVAERVLYMPSIGFCILVAAGFQNLLLYFKDFYWKQGLWFGMISLLLIFCIKTIHRNYDWKNEFTLFMSAVRINRENAKLFNNVGHALETEHKYQAALRFFKRAAMIQPDDMGAHINVGRTLVVLGQFAEAEAVYQLAMGLLPPVKTGQSYTARLAPNHLNIFINYANLISKNASRLNEAELLLRNAVSMRSDFVQAYINRADILIRLNRSKEAMSLYETALQYEPYNADVHYNMGVVHLEAARHEQSLMAFEKALEHDPQHRQALFNSAILLQDMATSINSTKTKTGFRKEALRRLRLLSTISPNDEKIYFNIALILTDMNEKEDARYNFEVAVKLKPDFRAALFNLALLISNDLHKPLEAVGFLEQLLRHHPQHTNALILLGDIYVNHLKDFNRAEQCFTQILKYDPTNVQAHHNLCVVYVERGLLRQAETCLSALALSAPNEEYILKHLNIVRQRILAKSKSDKKTAN